ncbi:GNAT family N-acetyltransferase [Microbacterium sp.]|uniref:GNAT family N-acetyltransferase n=1 Tax=Microbacterium sp. TaxID=51671 RepID=UPI0039E7130C
MNAWQVEPITVPASLDDDDAGPFRALWELENRVGPHDAGHDLWDQDAAEHLPWWRDQPDARELGFTVSLADRVLGAARLTLPREDAAVTGDFAVFVHPVARGLGVEDALLDAVEDTARGAGFSELHTFSMHRPGSTGHRLVPQTGERTSVLDLAAPATSLEELLGEAQRTAGSDYEVVCWTIPTPDELADDLAAVIARMSTDAPSGDLNVTAEIWDAERVRTRERAFAEADQLVSIAAARHVPSGRLVAYNELCVGADRTATTQQWGTLVLREHRGHRLGTIVKCANLLRWRELVPESPRVATGNAAENVHMLAINDAIGFEPASWSGVWQKVLD